MMRKQSGIARKGACLALAMSLALAGAAATDGTAWPSTVTFSVIDHWLYGVMPSADGAAIFPPTVTTVNITNVVQVNRIELPDHGPTNDTCNITFAKEGSLTFTGTDGGINLENTAVFPKIRNQAVVQFQSPTVCIPSGATATFGGGGSFQLTDLAGSGTLKLTDNALTVTQPSPSFTGTLDLNCGKFNFTPSASGAFGPTSLALSGSCNLFANGSSGKSATVTIGSLGTRQNRAILEVGGGDSRKLGTDDKVIVTDTSTVPVHDGFVDPVILGRASKLTFKQWDDLHAYFLTYDATDGFKLFTPTKTLAEATATDIALVDSAVSATTKTVKNVAIQYATKTQNTFLTVPSGVTLTVGDGANPAAILVNTCTNQSGYQATTIAGDGTIAFGGSEGILAFASGHPHSSLTVSPKITGSNGMTFMNAVHQPSYIQLNKSAGWTGPTHIWNERLKLTDANRLPAGGDVYVDGEKGYASASLWFYADNSATMTFDQRFHVRGHGGLVNQPYGVFWAYPNSGIIKVYFTGSIALTGDADFNAGYAIGATEPVAYPSWFIFNCPVSGKGLLTLAGGYHCFYAGSSVSGLDGLYVRGKGRLIAEESDFSEAGYLKGDAGTRADFRRMSGTTFSGGVQSEGYVRFVTGTNTLVGVSSIGTLALEGGAVVSVDGHLTAGVAETAMMDGNAKIVAAKGKASVFEVNATNDQSLAIHVEDGDGTLDFVKSGAGTLKLGGTLAYTGKTVVKEGTLTFSKSIMDDPGISWWFDATNAAAMMKNDNGKVMSVASKVGTQRLVNWNSSYTGPKVVNQLNGQDVFTYTHDDHDGFRTENETCQRTVFLVDKPRTHYAIMGLYGDFGDRGVRAETSTSLYNWIRNSSGYVSDLSVNGSDYTWKIPYETNKAQIVALKQGRADNYTTTGNIFYSHYQAYIGLYCNYDSRGFDGDIAEMIAYNRVLTEEEGLQVQKYLADRWGIALTRQPVGTATPVRPLAASALEIADGATLDLAGRDLTVASLTGAGAIVNTGATAARLIVTGTSDFRGTVGAGVTLKAAGSLKLAVAAGGGLDLASGTTTLGKNYFTPMTNDLALWLDASRVETITTNASGAAKGRVTEWRSLAGRMTSVVSGLGPKKTYYWGPLYGVDSDGKPACCFDATNNLSRVKMSPRTVLVAAKLRALPGNAVTIWGLYNKDSEWRTDTNGNATFGRNNTSSDEMTIEHADGTSSLKMSAEDRFISVWRAQDGKFPSYKNDPHWIDGADGVNCVGFTLGGNFNISVLQDVNEVIVYERYLTDDELAPILEYLRDKWIRSSGATVGRQPAAVLADGASLALSGGTTDLSALGSVTLATLANNGAGGTLTGNVTVTDAFTVDAQGASTLSPLVVNGTLNLSAEARAYCYNYTNLTRDVMYPALDVKGSLTGSGTLPLGAELVRRWLWSRDQSGTVWRLGRPNVGFSILVR